MWIGVANGSVRAGFPCFIMAKGTTSGQCSWGATKLTFFNLQTGWEKKDALDGVQETVKLTLLGAGVVQW
jgi:hypothetical protein